MESLLESLSHAVAELTGLAPTASYYAVLVAIVVIALVVLGGLVCLAEWLDVPQSFEKAQPPGISPAPVIWGGRWLHHEMQKYQFVITGTPRSGKSLLLLLYLRSVLSQITPGSGRRLILFDPKNELHPYIFRIRTGPGVLPPAE